VVNRQKRKGTDWERQLVDLLEGNIRGVKAKRIAGSGAIGTILGEPLLSGDVIVSFTGFPKTFRIEAKTGYGGVSQLTIKREWINKIIEEANNTYSMPMLACKFSGSKKDGGVQYFFILDFSTFCGIINYVNDLKREVDLLYDELGKEKKDKNG